MMFGSYNRGLMSYSVRVQKQAVTLFLQDFGGALLQDGQVRQHCHHLRSKERTFTLNSGLKIEEIFCTASRHVPLISRQSLPVPGAKLVWRVLVFLFAAPGLWSRACPPSGGPCRPAAGSGWR